MKIKTPLYPAGGSLKDKFGFPHYEEIQKTNQAFKIFYSKELEERKVKRRKARGAINSIKWKSESTKINTRLKKLLNLETSAKSKKYEKPEIIFKTNFAQNNESFTLTKFEAKSEHGNLCFTEVFSNTVTPQTNLCILIPSSGPGFTSLQSPQDLLNEFLPLLSANSKILIPHYDSLTNFSATHNKGLIIQGRSQFSEIVQETIATLNHYLTIRGEALTHLFVGGKDMGATAALLVGAIAPSITGVFALNPIMLGQLATHEALMIPYFNRNTDMEEIIALNLNHQLYLATNEKIILPKSKGLTLLKSKSLNLAALIKWIPTATKQKKEPIKQIALNKINLGTRKYNITKVKSQSQWKSTRAQLLSKYQELCSLPKNLKPISVKKVGESILEDSIRTEYQIKTSAYTMANLTFYQPKGSTGKLGTVLCLPGSGSDVAKVEAQYVHEVIANGWNAITIDARVRLYEFHPSIPESTSIIAQSIFDILVCCDWVFKQPQVDASKVATMGLSQGATHSWMLAALEPRISAAAVACGFCTYESVINEKVNEYYGGNDRSFLDSHSIYYYIPYLLQFADQQDLCALIAPRSLMLLCADHDDCFPLSGIRKGGNELKHIYKLLKASENYKLVEFAGVHSMPLDTREMAYKFFTKVFGK